VRGVFLFVEFSMLMVRISFLRKDLVEGKSIYSGVVFSKREYQTSNSMQY
jgi:hypothetical protein